MQGLHLTADLFDCRTPQRLFSDPSALRTACLEAVAMAGLQAVDYCFHAFSPQMGDPPQGGVTGVVLLAESHMAVHTWPEQAAVTVDVYVCNFLQDNSARAETLLAALTDLFAPGRQCVHRLQRGTPTPAFGGSHP